MALAQKPLGRQFNRDMINAIESMFTELYSEYTRAGLDAAEAKEKAIQAVADALYAKETAETTRDELTRIIREQTAGGDVVPEVVQARGTHNTVGERLDSISQDLAQTEDKLSITSRNVVEYGARSGRHVHIYRWGSPFGGNDWCFVRTPDSYDPEGAPHQVIVLNHGNGWIMNGTEARANFSEKTQFGVDTQNNGAYLDTNRPDYVEYSSPLIEALLAKGYVVVGAQNDGGRAGAAAGYGNRETRQNIRLFFDHVVENYNVKDYCHMIGASNGCLATLNATFLMREKIRSITLLYPLINLYTAWKESHQSGVVAAYNLKNTTFNEFRSKTTGHNPFVAYTDFSFIVDDEDESVYANANNYRLNQNAETKDITWLRENRLVDDSVSSDTGLTLFSTQIHRRVNFPYPRIRCHYSMGDTVVPQEKHWLGFKKLLDRGNILNYGLEVTGQHGDYTHFEGLDGNGIQSIISWIEY